MASFCFVSEQNVTSEHGLRERVKTFESGTGFIFLVGSVFHYGNKIMFLDKITQIEGDEHFFPIINSGIPCFIPFALCLCSIVWSRRMGELMVFGFLRRNKYYSCFDQNEIFLTYFRFKEKRTFGHFKIGFGQHFPHGSNSKVEKCSIHIDV